MPKYNVLINPIINLFRLPQKNFLRIYNSIEGREFYQGSSLCYELPGSGQDLRGFVLASVALE